MVLLFGVALLFTWLCFVAGNKFCNWLGVLMNEEDLSTDLLLHFLVGFALLGTWCNIWSLVLPVNFMSLLPLIILCVWMVRKKANRSAFSSLSKKIKKLFSFSYLPWVLPVILVVFVFSILAPQHGDSPGYHYATIRWIEEFKIIPGLANLQGRFGFNSSFFTTSAAFSLQSITGQALYPLNIAFAIAFFAWLLHKILIHKNSWWSLIYAAALIAMLRGIILTISSPTPDIIATIIMFYALVETAERMLTKGALSLLYKYKLGILIVFAITIKLSCLFLLPLFVLFYIDGITGFSKKAWILFSVFVLLLAMPWLIRNYILTGYLIYPIAFTGFLAPDWQVPFGVLHFDKLLINNGPKMISDQWEEVNSLTFFEWFPLWIKSNFEQGLVMSFVLFISSFAAIITGLFLTIKQQEKKLSIIFFINFIAVIFWLLNSPDYRFGYGYLLAGVVLLGFYLTKNKKVGKKLNFVVVLFFIAGCAYYCQYGARLTSGYSFSAYWYKPMPPKEMMAVKDETTFKYLQLNQNVRLYLEDKNHDCNNANLPCFSIFYQELNPGWIELRGTSIKDGFRMKKGVLQ